MAPRSCSPLRYSTLNAFDHSSPSCHCNHYELCCCSVAQNIRSCFKMQSQAHSPIFKPKTIVITPTNTHDNMPCCCLSRCVYLYLYVCYMYDCLPIFDSNRMCPSREGGGSNTYNIPYSHICGAIKYKCKAGGRKWGIHSRRQLGKRDSRRGNDSVFRKNFVHAPSPPCGYWRAN